MMIDIENRLSNAQAITATAVSQNVIDQGQSNLAHGPTDLVVGLLVLASFNNLTTLAIELQCDDNVGFTTPRVLNKQTIPLAELVAKARFTIGLPNEGVERFLRLNYVVTGTNPTLGQITAWLARAGEFETVR